MGLVDDDTLRSRGGEKDRIVTEAMAAAILGGNPVDVDFPELSGSGPSGGRGCAGGGGGIGSTGSGMIYIHKLDGSFVKTTSGAPSDFGFRVPSRARRISS